MSDREFNEAKQLYLEKYGDAIVTNNYLKIAVALVCVAALGLVILNLKTIHTFRNFRPLVIRIDQLGRAQAVDYKSLEYHPGDREAKYFLSEFCRLYYRRNRYTIHDDFTKALYFLDGKLANDTMEEHKKEHTVDKFLTNPSSPEVDIDIEKVALAAMENPPYRASVDFYQIEYAPADHSVLKKTLYTANFVFLFEDEVPNELTPVNPLGMTITYFRQDQAFHERGAAMIANALFAAAVVALAVLFYLADQLRFLAPYRFLIVQHYLPPILLSITVLFVNLTAAFFALGRRFFLKDTGSKLAHFDRELNAGRTPMPPHLHREDLN